MFDTFMLTFSVYADAHNHLVAERIKAIARGDSRVASIATDNLQIVSETLSDMTDYAFSTGRAERV